MDTIDKILNDTLEQGQLLFLLYPEWLQTAIVDNPALSVWNFECVAWAGYHTFTEPLDSYCSEEDITSHYIEKLAK